MRTIRDIMRFIMLSRRIRTLALLSVILLSLFLVYRWMFSEAGKPQLFAVYREASERELIAALVPGVDSNPLRQELNRTLREVLADGVGADDRLQGAGRGIELLNQSEKQIDAIGSVQDEVLQKRIAYEKGSLASGIRSLVGGEGDLAILLKKRSDIAGDIRGLSYRANFHTEEIFKRIIADRGYLTEAHMMSLNELIPKVEEQFNKRSNLYQELDVVSNRIETLSADL